MRNLLQHYLKRSINWFIDFLFMSFFHIYIWVKKKYHNLRKKKFAPSIVNEISIEVNVSEECDNDLHYVNEDYRHHTLPDTRQIVRTINRKNEIKETVSTYLGYFIQMSLFYFVVLYFYPNPRVDTTITPILNPTLNKTTSDIFWYHANIDFKKFANLDILMDRYGQTIMQKCQPLSTKSIVSNLWRRSDGSLLDLTFLYHTMCHLAIDKSLHSKIISIVTPKILNISEFRTVNSDIPTKLFHSDTISIKEYNVPNICVMVVAIPENSEKSNHDHHPFSFEAALNEDLPPGTFVHTSKKTSVSFETNPSLSKNTSEIWAPRPTPGKCAILINPSIAATDNQNEDIYTIIHSLSLIEEKRRFETDILKSISVSYHDTSFTAQTWNPADQNQNMQFQTLFYLMQSQNSMKLAD